MTNPLCSISLATAPPDDCASPPDDEPNRRLRNDMAHLRGIRAGRYCSQAAGINPSSSGPPAGRQESRPLAAEEFLERLCRLLQYVDRPRALLRVRSEGIGERCAQPATNCLQAAPALGRLVVAAVGALLLVAPVEPFARPRHLAAEALEMLEHMR